MSLSTWMCCIDYKRVNIALYICNAIFTFKIKSARVEVEGVNQKTSSAILDSGSMIVVKKTGYPHVSMTTPKSPKKWMKISTNTERTRFVQFLIHVYVSVAIKPDDDNRRLSGFIYKF
jgi:hypothetical protein